MFLLRSAFWLTLAFLVIKPGMAGDVTDSAANLSRDAMANGSQFIAEQIEAIECTEIQCLGGKAIAAAALRSTQYAGDPMHIEPASTQVPLPRPRPEQAG